MTRNLFMKKLNLLTPGPVPMPPEVYNALGELMSHHRTPEFTKLLIDCHNNLKNFLVQNNLYFFILPLDLAQWSLR